MPGGKQSADVEMTEEAQKQTWAIRAMLSPPRFLVSNQRTDESTKTLAKGRLREKWQIGN